MPPSLLLAVLLLVPSSLSVANKTPRHVAPASGHFAFDSNAGSASSFASSSGGSYSSSGSFGGSSGGVKGGCPGGCGGSFGSPSSVKGVSAFVGGGAPGNAGFGGGFGGVAGSSAGSFASAGSGHGVFPGGEDLSNVAFWWAGQDSPFRQANEYYRKCALKGDCANVPGPFNIPGFQAPNNIPQGGAFSGSFNAGDKTHGKDSASFGPIDISNNPFLNGEYKGVAISSCSGVGCPGGKPHVTFTNCKGTDCKTTKHEGDVKEGAIDFSNNPFLSGAFAGSGGFGTGSSFGGSTGGSSSGGSTGGSSFGGSIGGSTLGGSIGGSSFGGSTGGSSFKGSHGAGSHIAGERPGTSFGSSDGQSAFGKPGYQSGQGTITTAGSGSATTIGAGAGSSSFGQTFPTSQPGHFGATGSFQHGSSSSASGSSSSSFGTTVAGGYQHGQQAFPTSQPGQSGSGSQPSHGGASCTFGSGCQQGQSIPSSYPGQDKKPSSYPEQGKQPTPACYPGQPCASGSQQGKQPIPTSFPGQYEKPQTIPTCYPGEPCDGGSQPGKEPTCYPGQPCFSGSQQGKQPIPTSYPSQTDKPQSIPTCYPGQPCYTGSQQGKQPIPTNYPSQTDKPLTIPTCYPGQPCSSGSQQGKQPIPSSYPGQSIPTCYPGQSCASGSQPGKQPIPSSYPGELTPTCYPGQPCASGSQQGKQPIPSSYPGETTPTCYPGQPCASGSQQGKQPIPSSYPGQATPTCYPGQPCASGSQPGKEVPCAPGTQCYGGYQPGQPSAPCKPGSPCSSGSQPGYSGSQSFPTSQTGFITSFQHGQSGSTAHGGSAFGSTSFTSSPFGQKPGSTSFQETGKYPSGSTSFGGSTSFTGNPYGPSKPIHGSGKAPGGDIDGELTLRCGGAGYICVEKHICNNGIVNNHGEGLFQVRSEEQYCNVNSQVCCRLPNAPTQPHKNPDLQIPGSQFFSSTSQHSASAASSASTSSNSIYTSSGPSPTSAGHIASQYTPGRTTYPDSTVSGTGQSGLVHIPPRDTLAPGQTIPFGGSSGNSPGLIHVLPDSPTGRPFTPAPGLIHVPPGSQPGQSFPIEGQPGRSPGLIHVLPNSDSEVPRPFTSGPNDVQVSPNGGSSKPGLIHVTPSAHEQTFKDVQNELGSASTLQGPAYLPPDASPTPNSFTPDLIPPKSPFITAQPSIPSPSVLIPQKPSTFYPQPTTIRTTQRPYYSPTTLKPTIYYPTTPRRPQTNENYPPQYPAGSDNTNEYLPPDGTSIVSTALIPSRTTPRPYVPPRVPDSNIIKVNILKPPQDENPDSANDRETRLRPPTSPRPVTDYPFQGDLNTTPYPGCAAALKCVLAQFCSAEGVISTVPVILTKEQETQRVPTTDCADPETGIIGKCCRDPNYKDPWPASQLGLYNPNDGFDNGQYKETNNGGKFAKPPGSKGPQPGIKGRPQRPFLQEPNQIGSPSNNPATFVRPEGYPSQVPGIPFDHRQVNRPLQVDDKGPVETNLNEKYPISASKVSSQTCGLRHPGGKPSGQGPIDVDFAEIPWQAMILRDSNRSLLCGGAIIRQDAVITAAHCVEGLHSDDVLVKGGEWKLGIDEEPKPFQIIKVAAIVRHPGYKQDNRFNDVAILILTERFRLDKNVDTICLPGSGEDIQTSFQDKKCITTGWGKTTLQLHVLNSLMHSLEVGLVPASQCQSTLQQYHSQSVPYYNTNCVCGATIQPQTDICDVDIGSALACDRGDGHFTLAGVYSWDTGCGSPSQLAGYTKVDSLWVESQLSRPISDLKTEENGFYQRLYHDHTGPECHCKNGKK